MSNIRSSRLMMSETTASISIGSFDLRAHSVRDYRTAEDIERERRAALGPVRRRWSDSMWIEGLLFLGVVLFLIVGAFLVASAGSSSISKPDRTPAGWSWSTGGTATDQH